MATIENQQVDVQAQQGGNDANADQYNLTPAQFREYLGQLATYFNQLSELGDAVATLQRGQKIQLGNGATIGKRELRSYRSSFLAELRGLARYYTAAKRPRRTTRATGRTNGFNIPIVVTQNVRNFFAEANLGNAVDPVSNQPINSMLNQHLQFLINYGVTSSAILTPLFCIYAVVNNLQHEDNRQFLRADELMMRHFGETFAELAQQEQRTNRAGEAIPVFDPNRFRYASFQSIVSRNTIKPPQGATHSDLWTNDQVAVIDRLRLALNAGAETLTNVDPQILQEATDYNERFTAEQQIASATLAYYRNARQPQDKAMRAQRRREQNAQRRAQQQQQQQAQQFAQQGGIVPLQQVNTQPFANFGMNQGFTQQ